MGKQKNHGPSVKNDAQYEALRDEGTARRKLRESPTRKTLERRVAKLKHTRTELKRNFMIRQSKLELKIAVR